MTSVTILLLQAAISLLLLVQANPDLNASLREQAIEVANHAIKVATKQSVTKAPHTAWPTFQEPTLAFSASPTTITSGESTALSWYTTNATSCISVGSEMPYSLGTSGNISVSPLKGARYTLNCTGPGGSVTQNVTVDVTSGSAYHTPHITSTSAKAAGNFEMDAGGSASIYGSNLGGSDLGIARVFIGGIEATRLSVSYDRLSIMVPSSLQAGQSYDLYVSNVYGTSNSVRVKILSKLNAAPQPIHIDARWSLVGFEGQYKRYSLQLSGATSGNSVTWWDMTFSCPSSIDEVIVKVAGDVCTGETYRVGSSQENGDSEILMNVLYPDYNSVADLKIRIRAIGSDGSTMDDINVVIPVHKG